MEHRPHKTLIIACGAIAKEILAIKANMGIGDGVFDLTCLPASYHNFPDKIVPGIEAVIDARGGDYDRIFLGYGDCGTGGGLDRMMEKHPKTTRLPGAHCYAFYARLGTFDDMMEEELGSFFLTDYLARHFETLIVKGFGIDRFPDLKETYFENYNRLVYLSQQADADLIARAKSAAEYLELEYIHRPVGYGHLEAQISSLSADEGGVDDEQVKIYTGRCHCEGVSFSAEGLSDIWYCHCKQCQHLTGLYIAAAGVPRENLKIDGDVNWFPISEKSESGHCRTCGSYLFWNNPSRPTISVVAGNIDDTFGLEVKGHIYVSEKGRYYEITDDLPQYQTIPEGTLRA